MRRDRMHRAVLSALPLVAACYSYAPIDPASAAPGTDVRARISPAAAERIAPLLGSEHRVVAGRLIDVGAGAMIVEVPTVAPSASPGVVETLHQRVSIVRSDLLELETRRLDRWRTGAIVGGAAVLAGGLWINSMRGGPGLDRVTPIGGNESRRPDRPRVFQVNAWDLLTVFRRF